MKALKSYERAKTVKNQEFTCVNASKHSQHLLKELD